MPALFSAVIQNPQLLKKGYIYSALFEELQIFEENESQLCEYTEEQGFLSEDLSILAYLLSRCLFPHLPHLLGLEERSEND